MGSQETSRESKGGVEDFTALLQRLRAPESPPHRKRRKSVKRVPMNDVKKVRPLQPVALSANMTTLLHIWTGGDKTVHVISDDEELPASPSPPRTSSSASFDLPSDPPASPSSTTSAFAPCTDYLPVLLRDTIGRGPRTPGTRVQCDASRPFSCVVVDVETTGFSPQRNEMVEIGCVELRWNPPVLGDASDAHVSAFALYRASSASLGDITPVGSPTHTSPTSTAGFWARGQRSFHRRIRPSSPAAMTAATTAVHGITWDMVKGCDAWPVVAEELLEFLRSVAQSSSPAVSPAGSERSAPSGQSSRVRVPPLVAHNSYFDASFLREHLQRCGYDMVWDALYPMTCSLQWVRRAYPHVAANLGAICTFLGIDGAAERAAGYHGAFIDATLTAKLFLQLCRRYEQSKLLGTV